MAVPQLVAVEFTVSDLGPPLALLSQVLGMEVAAAGRHPTIDAVVAQVDAGGVLVNLLCPTDTGEGEPLATPEPRLSQLNFAVGDTEELIELRRRCEEAGAAVVEHGDTLFYIDSHLTGGILGADATLVFTCGGPDGGGSDR